MDELPEGVASTDSGPGEGDRAELEAGCLPGRLEFLRFLGLHVLLSLGCQESPYILNYLKPSFSLKCVCVGCLYFPTQRGGILKW